jgi:hypothetical protein
VSLEPVHAVIVAGHAVLRHFADPTADDNWVLLDFQHGEGGCYVEHVQRGVERTAADPQALLIFSGGQSRVDAGPLSEAYSYYWIAQHYGWFGHPGVAARTLTEEFARDSFENLLFGLCRCKEWTGAYPERVTFVGWRFKQQRFELHREAIRWPLARYEYDGANDPPQRGQAETAEAQTHAGYLADPYSSGDVYRAKRESRNPFRRQPGYATSCPELAGLFAHPGPGRYRGPLPWDR